MHVDSKEGLELRLVHHSTLIMLYMHNPQSVICIVYGALQVPRTLWNASRRTHTLNHCYFKAAKLCTDMSEADEKLSEAVEVRQLFEHTTVY